MVFSKSLDKLADLERELREHLHQHDLPWRAVPGSAGVGEYREFSWLYSRHSQIRGIRIENPRF